MNAGDYEKSDYECIVEGTPSYLDAIPKNITLNKIMGEICWKYEIKGKSAIYHHWEIMSQTCFLEFAIDKKYKPYSLM